MAARSRTKTPAQVVLQLFRDDGLSARGLALELDVNVTTVTRWGWARPRGCGGTIPARYHLRLLELAAERRLSLKPRDLILGRG